MKTRRWIENALLLTAGVALGVWLWPNVGGPIFQSWENWVFDRESRGEPATITEYLVEREQQIAGKVRIWWGWPAIPRQSVSPSVVPEAVRPRSIENNGLVGRLSIPRLHLSVVVREGTGEDTLGLTLGHIPGTALPGQKGNVGVAGHRDTLFRGLRDIQKNDLILFETLAGSYVYEVESTDIVSPQNVSVLRASQHPELTLVTCYPFYYVGSAPDRFIVKAYQVPRRPLDREFFEPQQQTAQQANELTTAHKESAENDGHQDRQLTGMADRANPSASAQDGVENKLGARKVSFQIAKNHSRQLVPGISLGVTGTDAACRCVDGWMWVMPDRRTIWLRNQGTHEPVAFYGYHDGKKRELVITNVTNYSVTGYLLLLQSPTTERIPAPLAARAASAN